MFKPEDRFGSHMTPLYVPFPNVSTLSKPPFSSTPIICPCNLNIGTGVQT